MYNTYAPANLIFSSISGTQYIDKYILISITNSYLKIAMQYTVVRPGLRARKIDILRLNTKVYFRKRYNIELA